MYSPYAALGSNQQSYVVGAANTRLNRYQQQSNSDYYDYYDYGNGGGQSNYQRPAVQQQGRVNRNTLANQQGVNRRMSNLKAAASGGYGSYSGDDYCDNGISIGLLLTAALGIAVMFYTLYTKITMAGGRRRRKKRNEVENILEDIEEEIDPIKFAIDHITDFLYSGNYIFFHFPMGVSKACCINVFINEQIRNLRVVVLSSLENKENCKLRF